MKTLIIMLLVIFTIGTSNAAWEKVNGPFCMRVSCIETDSFGNIFAGSFDGAILVSRDKGISWSKTSFVVNDRITGIVCNQKGLIYAASLVGGLFFSTDEGETWQTTAKTTGNLVYCFALCLSGELLLFDGNGFYSSLDTGKTYNEIKIAEYGMLIRDIKVNSDGDVFIACSDNGVYRRKSGDTLWNNVFGTKIYRTIDNIYAVDSANIVIMGNYRKNINGNTIRIYNCLFHSSNKGSTWQRIINFSDTTSFTAGAYDSNGDLYLCTENGIHKGNFVDSLFLQKSLIELNINYFYAIKFTEKDVCLLGSNGLGIFISEDKGNSWKLSNNGMDLNEIKSIVFNSKNDIFTSLNSGGIFKSDDNGNSWSKVNKQSNLNATSVLLCDDLDILYAGTFSEGFFKSEDNGENWKEINNGVYSDFSKRSVIDIKKDKRGVLWGGCMSNIYYSYDNGETWDYLNIYYLSCFNILDTTLYYCASNGQKFDAFKSTDIALKFDKIDSLGGMELSGFAMNSKGMIFASSMDNYNKKGILRSIDSGKTWTQVNNGLKYLNINTIYIDKSDNIYVAVADGVYRSTDSGNSWFQFNESFPVNIKVIKFNEDRNGILYAATKTNGLYRFNPTVDVKEESTNQNFCFDIFPNPAEDYIEISVGAQCSVPNIRIYNVFGETVRTPPQPSPKERA